MMGNGYCAVWRVSGCPDRAMVRGEEPGLSWERRKESFARLTGGMISLISVGRAYRSCVCVGSKAQGVCEMCFFLHLTSSTGPLQNIQKARLSKRKRIKTRYNSNIV